MTLYYEEYGNKEAPMIVFLHGGGVSGWMWDQQVHHFSNYHCLVPTLQGHGKRNKETTFSINSCAKEIIDLIEEKGAGKDVTLVGFSLGAQVAIEILGLAPDLIRYAVINSALVMPMSMRMINYMVTPTIKLTAGLAKNRIFSRIQAKELYIGDDTFETYYQESANMNANTLVEILRENLRYDLPPNFSDCTAKILVTVGEKEKSIMKKSAVKIANSNTNSKCVVVPNIGHGFSFADSMLFNQTVEAWITDGDLPIEKLKVWDDEGK
ncbi:alpha/beta fold hydrolase [Risungbinella massiliensis]|uniref:alpha/beta fold hydrolase n=1 Tax=Risungbinella massiliensis TaxID=1329796 RepID=UPI0005CBC675|nr:alpha/beta hydrolase [Risungbinella massiliensis]